MTLRKLRNTWKPATLAAFAAVLVLASPAAAVDSSTSLAVSPAAPVVDQAVTLAATVTCGADPSGGLGVTFFDGAELLATVPVGTDGSAALRTTFDTTGAHTIVAAYNGDDDCSASNDQTTVTVSEAPPPPTQPSGLCLLACSGLFGFQTGDIHNEVNIRQGH
ncbi:Ig-like domain-containing protein [Actinacidiphila bryophytorum]|uniref:Ig-like domain-containing protein n=1 Tax=Actinacidiphila bryophytorum TaxID=1436133 RepID=UPI002176AD20|nr:Ig-like domain-containing protein [Actinacidiphila bryophytorum]UWE08554.1 Ig-like domain-containing protein [Actinacidiphila bryophytorum]